MERRRRATARFFAYLNLFMLRDARARPRRQPAASSSSAGRASASASYLLIGFWFDEDANARAGKKAFIVNRIGDFGFLLGDASCSSARSSARLELRATLAAVAVDDARR